MIIYIDIDETICTKQPDEDYSKCIPIKENIAKANSLYDAGNTIVYWTARGALTGIDSKYFTKKQLKTWGVKYHKLKFNKPYFDIFIDDKNINTRDWK